MAVYPLIDKKLGDELINEAFAYHGKTFKRMAEYFAEQHPLIQKLKDSEEKTVMAFIDSKGNQVQFGDYVTVSFKRDAASDAATGSAIGVVARIIALRETAKGVAAKGAYVSLIGNGRIAKFDVTPADSTLVMRSDGSRP